MSANKQPNNRTMTRAAIYARFSTDLQSERSTEDQIALCQAFADREGLTVIGSYEDRARSGGSVFGRDGLMRLMEAARGKTFDVLIVEALDRLSRDMEDLAGIHKRLSFLGIEIRAVHEGTVNTILVGLRGLMGQMFREDNAHKVRRGMAGRVRDGLSGGGVTYGYAPVQGEPGKRAIVEEEAEIVRRIFREYLEGRTARDIAHGLNRDGIRPPRGRAWNASTINGNAERGTGILNNDLYGGRLVWNRLRMIKDPDTGKRVSRPNPKSQWQIVEVPDLAIVPKDLYEAVRGRKSVRRQIHPSQQKRQRHLLSGLLRCGCCGAGMSTKGTDKSGRIRIRCSAAAESGTCPDPKTFYLEAVENAVLTGLRSELHHPVVLAEYVKTYREERLRLASKTIRDRARIERRLDELSREIERLVDAIAKGLGDIELLGPRSKALNQERKQLELQLAGTQEPPNVVALHPQALKRYQEMIERLQAVLARGVSASDMEASAVMRELVEKVTVYRDDSRAGGVQVEITGRLNVLLGDQAFPNGIRAVGGLMVAEEGFEPPTQGL